MVNYFQQGFKKCGIILLLFSVIVWYNLLMALKLLGNQQKVVKSSLNMRNDEFCKLYVSFDKEFYGNATACYTKVYGVKNYQVAQAASGRLLSNPKITARINELLSTEGFNDLNVDKQLLFIINQHKKLDVKMKGISEYNKLKKRVDNKIELIMPRPILGGDLDDDEVIHKIDKSKAKTVIPENDV